MFSFIFLNRPPHPCPSHGGEFKDSKGSSPHPYPSHGGEFKDNKPLTFNSNIHRPTIITYSDR
ncbi:MAG: hypothetical protein LBP62_07760 [Clostridiales bacterium]|nr:hypothetical protein [Clostridiales bacterium]